MVLDLQEKVAAAVRVLKERGLVSPYLRSFVVARINLLRSIKGEPPPLEEVLKTMRERARKLISRRSSRRIWQPEVHPTEEAWKALHTIGVEMCRQPGIPRRNWTGISVTAKSQSDN